MKAKGRRIAPFNRGRWEVERERSRLVDCCPPSSPREATPIDGVLNGLMARLGLQNEAWLTALQDQWVDLVGQTIAAHARPGRMQDGRLTVFVDHSVWLSELSRHSKTHLLEKLQEAFGKKRVRDVGFQLDPEQNAYKSGKTGKTRSNSSRR